MSAEDFTRWKAEVDRSVKIKGYQNWVARGKKIVKRYRDERGDYSGETGGSETLQGAKFNILWSNIQTLMPAVYAKPPKPIVERRYLDRDEIGRVSSVILERGISYEIEESNFFHSIKRAVLDRLLPGRGVVWVRYEPTFQPVSGKTQETDKPDVAAVKSGGAEIPAPSPQEEIAYECVKVDYIDWQDFLVSPARIWDEVWWVAKRVYMTREELEKRWPKLGSKITLDWAPLEISGSASSVPTPENDNLKKAKVIELWNKRDRKVIWFAESYTDDILEEKDDPLRLEGFFPTPRPLFATLTNETLVPVPDFYEYQDQANELDELTARISALTKVIKACGIVDASVPELLRMFEEGFENQLVGTENWAGFSEKIRGDGSAGMWLLPIKDLAAVLLQLYEAREQVKQSLFEITGISDIVRGQSQGAAKTATEQRIKGQFASLRLNDMQAEVVRFARDTLRIMGEVIAEHFDPMTLFLISGYEQYAQEQFAPQASAPPGPPQDGANGAGPAGASPPGGAMQPPMVGPAQEARQKSVEVFKKAIELLKNEKLRGFRIEIESDSMIEPDQQAMQQARSELLGAVSQFLPQAIQAGAAVPKMQPLLGRLLLFFLRGFKAGRDLESSFEQFIEDMSKQAANPQPKPLSPEEVKAQAEIQKAQMGMQTEQMKAQNNAQSKQMDMQAEQAKLAGEMQLNAAKITLMREELAIEQERLALKQQEIALDRELAIEKHKMEMEKIAASREEVREPVQ